MVEDAPTSLETRLCSISRAEQMAYFQGNVGHPPTSAFSLDHQLVLRAAALYSRTDLATLVHEYFTDLECRTNLIRKFSEGAASFEFERGADSPTYEAFRARFEECIPELGPDQIYFSNRFGFAAFCLKTSQDHHQLRFQDVELFGGASIGGLKPLCFNLTEPLRHVYVHNRAIEVLALSLYEIATSATATSLQESWAIRELRELIVRGARRDQFVGGLRDAMISHEVGHTYSMGERSELLPLLSRLGLPPSEVPPAGFPSKDWYGAWDRIRAGRFRAADILFLMSDGLANLTVLLDPPAEITMTLLRVINVILLKIPSPRNRPRGLGIFLKYALRRDAGNEWPHEIATLIQACLNQPETAASTLLVAERDAWDCLKESEFSYH